MVNVRQKLMEALMESVPEGINFTLLASEQVGHGDYSTNAALVIAKAHGRNPMEMAEAIRQPLEGALSEHVDKIDIVKPGFINFFLKREVFSQNLIEILERKETFGQHSVLANKKVVIEYTDPNPFKEFHIGHLMSNCIGEALARLLEFAGADVKRVNYQGDVGLHVAKAIWALKQSKSKASLNPQKLGEAYVAGDKAYSEDSEAKDKIEEINKKIYERSDDEINKLYDTGKEVSLEYFEKLYKRLGTKFDHYFFESNTGLKGKELVDVGLQRGVFEESDGAIVYRGEKDGLHTRVFITKSGIPTYEAKELGLAELKNEKFPSDTYIVVTGNEIVDYFRVVLEAAKKLLPDIADKIKHIPHGMLRFAEGKMGSRKGNVITTEKLLGEIGEKMMRKIDDSKDLSDDDKKLVLEDVSVGAVKYAILRQSIGRDIIFDFEKSLSFEGDSGPYLQYTFARTQSLLRKAEEAGITSSSKKPLYEALGVEKMMLYFPEVVLRAVENNSPQYISTYLFSFAHAFNQWYASERILKGDNVEYRLAVTEAVGIIMKNGLWLLGIESPEKM
jgi:arginyl-tRNA synthetase